MEIAIDLVALFAKSFALVKLLNLKIPCGGVGLIAFFLIADNLFI